ncbi:MAG: ACT domain-containing protein [Anaerolineales bacterium]|nr:ACT domain-containing protein [Anaerolineales bacterium]
MTGETDLTKLLHDMKPELHEGEFIYSLAPSLQKAFELEALCIFQEAEGVTVILPKGKADEAALSYSVVCAWITLTVHSSLEAVGLTAAVSKALTEAGISCNVVAAYYHDHIFVPIQDADRAMQALLTLCE